VCLEFYQRQVNGHVQTAIHVRDTGIGIRLEDQTKLFQSFTQVDASTKRRSEGAGLGLHLSQKLAELLGGRITVQSEYGAGSTFTLVLTDQ
jgi:protein-histidine pros-kinase